jgi:hypothetical protein
VCESVSEWCASLDRRTLRVGREFLGSRLQPPGDAVLAVTSWANGPPSAVPARRSPSVLCQNL